jgi:hypothetical protein
MRRVYAWETSHAAEHHFRIGMPFPLLDSSRFETARGGPAPELHDYDVVFAQRLAGYAPLWHELCADPNVLTVYDMDDDLLCVDPQNAFCYNIFHPLEPETRRNVLAADIVTVSSPGLLARFKEIHPNVVLLPICVPDDMVALPQVNLSELVIGWAGSMHKRQDWEANDMAGVLARFAVSQPDARFHMLGADYTNSLLGIRAQFTGFGLIGDYYNNIPFTVGLAPLMPSHFNDGKCHTKLIEYGARGIPTIASPIGQYTEWVIHGVNGMLARDPDDWTRCLNYLTDADARIAMGKAAHDTTCEWVISKHIHKWEQVFEGIVS